jgi:hypothetical protein
LQPARPGDEPPATRIEQRAVLPIDSAAIEATQVKRVDGAAQASDHELPRQCAEHALQLQFIIAASARERFDEELDCDQRNSRSKISSVGVGQPNKSRSIPIVSSMASPARRPARKPHVAVERNGRDAREGEAEEFIR